MTNAGNQPIVFAGAGNWASLSGGAGYFTGANTNQTGNASFNTCLNDGYSDNATHCHHDERARGGAAIPGAVVCLGRPQWSNPVTTNRL